MMEDMDFATRLIAFEGELMDNRLYESCPFLQE